MMANVDILANNDVTATIAAAESKGIWRHATALPQNQPSIRKQSRNPASVLRPCFGLVARVEKLKYYKHHVGERERKKKHGKRYSTISVRVQSSVRKVVS